MEKYDLILAVTTFRKLIFYLNIIKYLSADFRIGVYRFDTDERTRQKTEKTNQLFYDTCEEMGAKILDSFPVETDIAILPKENYERKQILEFKSDVLADRYFAFFPLMEGNRFLDRLSELEIDKYLVVDRDIYDFRLSLHPEEKQAPVPGDRIVETGMPTAAYPIFADVRMDYLIAVPTPFSLPTQEDRHDFLRCVCRLLENMQPGEVAALKPHNASEKTDYVVDARVYAAYRALGLGPLKALVSGAARLLHGFFTSVPLPGARRAREACCLVLNAALYEKIHRRAVRLAELTRYHNFNLEIFLPGVKKGIVTGFSNTVWHGLFNRLPVYNCADKEKIGINPDKFIHHSAKYYDVPYFNGELEFDEVLFAKVSDRVKNRDMIAFLRAELEAGSREEE